MTIVLIKILPFSMLVNSCFPMLVNKVDRGQPLMGSRDGHIINPRKNTLSSLCNINLTFPPVKLKYTYIHLT